MTATGASMALRGATNRLAKKLGKKPKHSGFPRADFDRLVSNVRDPRRVAEYYYQMGLRRGLIKATSYVADGKFTLDKEGTLWTDPKISVDVRLGLPGRSIVPRTFQFTAEDLGFDQ